MGKLIDLTGQRFGRLTVIKRNGSSKDKRAMWMCKCDCGNTITVIGKYLLNGDTQSCGCIRKELLHSNLLDLSGQRFGRLTAIEMVGYNDYSNGEKKSVWRCCCDCGNYIDVETSRLRSGNTQSCGCLAKDLLKQRATTHGMTESRLYMIWCGMKNRCYNPNEKAYKNYGGRGITVCPEWLEDFQNFYDWANTNGYADYLTIERKDVNGNYCPENCCWITKEEQARNKRDNHRITCHGKTFILTEWAEILGMTRGALKQRIRRSDKSDFEVVEQILEKKGIKI